MSWPAGAPAPHGKPVLACLMAERGRPVPLDTGDEQLPAYAFPENAARALGKAASYAEWRAQTPGLLWGFDDLHVDSARAACQEAIARQRDGWLTGEEVRRVLQAFGLPLALGGVARTGDAAATLAAEIGFPVAAKLTSTEIQHKTDIGAVRLNLMNAMEVRDAFDAILAAARTSCAGRTRRWRADPANGRRWRRSHDRASCRIRCSVRWWRLVWAASTWRFSKTSSCELRR